MLPLDPENWVDLLAYAIVSIPATIAAWAGVRHRRESKTRGSKLLSDTDEVLNQTKNKHDSNLRDDIDKLGDWIQEGFREVHRAISGLHDALNTEREERIEGDRDKGA